MFGQITSYSGTSLVVDVTVVGGSGTHTDWSIYVAGARGATGATGATGAAGADGASSLAPPDGRLTLTTATPVTTGDVTAATTIYYALYSGDKIPLYDGAAWASTTFTELSLALDSTGAHTGYHQSGKNFDLFIYNDAGTLRLASGPAWTNDTTRADAIARKNGRWTNNASIVLRFGSASWNTVTAAANLALYVGTFRASADGQTEDSAKKRFMWNFYHRARRHTANATETANSWTYTTATFRQANANTANQFEYVCGVAEDAVEATVQATASNSGASGTTSTVGIGVDSTSANSALATMTYTNNSATQYSSHTMAHYRGVPGLGYHYLAWLEWSTASGTTTWYGDNNIPSQQQSAIIGMVMA